MAGYKTIFIFLFSKILLWHCLKSRKDALKIIAPNGAPSQLYQMFEISMHLGTLGAGMTRRYVPLAMLSGKLKQIANTNWLQLTEKR